MDATVVSSTYVTIAALPTTLADLDKEAGDLIRNMVTGARALRTHASALIVAGVKMALIRESKREEWETYVRPYAGRIKVKGTNGQFRQIAGLLFRNLPKQSDADLETHTFSRSQISRYGDAIKYGYDQLQAARVTLDPEADNYLGEHILSIGGMRKAAAIANKSERDLSIGRPPENAPEQVDVENVGQGPETIVAPDNNDDLLITIGAVRLTRPVLYVIYPDGTYRRVNNLSETAFDTIVKISEQGILKN